MNYNQQLKFINRKAKITLLTNYYKTRLPRLRIFALTVARKFNSRWVGKSQHELMYYWTTTKHKLEMTHIKHERCMVHF